jgi:hypothetical protein
MALFAKRREERGHGFLKVAQTMSIVIARPAPFAGRSNLRGSQLQLYRTLRKP